MCSWAPYGVARQKKNHDNNDDYMISMIIFPLLEFFILFVSCSSACCCFFRLFYLKHEHNVITQRQDAVCMHYFYLNTHVNINIVYAKWKSSNTLMFAYFVRCT